MDKRLSKKEQRQLVEIATGCCPSLKERQDLESHCNDTEDFYEIAVWCLSDAITEAYLLGKKNGKEDK